MDQIPTADEALWARARIGSERDFTALFDRHSDRVYQHALRLTRNRVDAEDVTAAAFFELWRRRDSVRVVEGSILPWLLVAATNFARNSGRSRRRYENLIRGLTRDMSQESARDPGETSQTRDDLKEAIDALSPKDAALLALVAIEGLKVSEAGRALGLSDGAARVRLLRAKKRARKYLEPKFEPLRGEETSSVATTGEAPT